MRQRLHLKLSIGRGAALLIGLLGLTACQPPDPPKISPTESPKIEETGRLILNNATLEQANPSGQPLWKIQVKKATYTQDQKIARPEHLRLLDMVAQADASRPKRRTGPGPIRAFLERVGRGVMSVVEETYGTLAFAGRLMVVTARTLTDPRRIRWASCVSMAERAGLDALPIVVVTTFFIGAVVGLLGVNTLRQFGAEVFAVELIGIAVTREFGIVITAVLLAGRSASAFAAEIGSMKMTQEVDAMRVMGVDPFEALVFPRVAALLLTIPLLTFAATVAGLMGGALVTWSMLGLGPTFFMTRLVESVGATHFWIALSKAPVMAIAIAGIGCRQGMLVKGDVLSLGQRVTAAVVQAIFAIILIDAVFALIYMELDL